MMKIKNAIYLLFAVLVMVGCDNGSGSQKYSTDLINNPNTASGDTSKKQVPEITFDKKMHDFGRLSQGESIAYSFKFTNTGNADLVISNCDATCGCTVADFPKNRIKPGETGYITVSFNSAGKYGQEEQMIEVMANTQPSRTQLIVRALVEN
jgi:hypothetical protein